SYIADDAGLNTIKSHLESILRTIPEESMRLQFRFEVTEDLGDLLERYQGCSRTQDEATLAMDQNRLAMWQQKEAGGEYLRRMTHLYLIWDSERHHRVLAVSGKTAKRNKDSGGFSLSTRKIVQRTLKEHVDLISEFESLLNGIESAMVAAGLDPQRMSDQDLFLETKRALSPMRPDPLPLRQHPYSERYVTPREQCSVVSILGQTEDYINIDGLLWSFITLKAPPDATYPGILRSLLTSGLPVVVSTQVTIPNQSKVLERFKKRHKKMMAAQRDSKGNLRIDVTAQVAEAELLRIQQDIIASSLKAVKVSLTIGVRTSKAAHTTAEYEEAEREIASRKQQILHIISRMNGASGLTEDIAQRRTFLSSLPGLAGEDKREIDLLSCHAADLLPLEMPWTGTPRSPLMLIETPYRQLIPFSPFDPDLSDANMLVAAASGHGKSMMTGQMLLQAARQDTRVSIIERGDSYRNLVEYMGGQMITMALDSEQTLNPWDLESGEREPSREQVAFLKGLTRHMLGDIEASDLLDNVLVDAIERTYRRAAMRPGNTIPTFGDLRDELQYYQDADRNERVMEEARLAAFKLRNWVSPGGVYENLFDRQTTLKLDSPWIYFNVEKLKDDPRLESAMSLLIAWATTKRASGKSSHKSITVLEECWMLLESPFLADLVVQLYRTARKRNGAVWGVSQAIEDFTGTTQAPNAFGAAILKNTTIKIIGRQTGSLDVLREFLHLNETTLNEIKNLGHTQKGRKSDFIVVIGEKAETTHTLRVVLSPIEYWIMTTYPRERWYRAWWMKKHFELPLYERYCLLAENFPQGMAALEELPEERSGEVYEIQDRVREQSARAQGAGR
ncbi:MAG: hypothetical protein WCC92_13375, partial [Candidatus Korobacteraceae bacterium]